jgi:hypothetical protein
LGRQIKSALFGLGLKLKLGISPGLWLADGTGLFGLVILFMKGQHNILGLFSNLLTCTAYVTVALGVYGMWNNLSFPFMMMLALLAMHCLVIRAWRLLIEVIG